MLHYKISPFSCQAHLFEVILTIQSPASNGQIIQLAAWIPGSYMIRDFARNIIKITAKGGEKPLKLTKLDKQRWQIEPCEDTIEVTYQVYALDLSVRSAWLDSQRGYFNGCSVFMQVLGQEDQPCKVKICAPQDHSNWRLATTLTRITAPKWGFGLYQADNYQHLIDCPVEMSNFKVLDFVIQDIPHYLVISGQYQCDESRLIKDLTQICQQQVSLFKGDLPLKQYLFLLLVVSDGYGGLEHLDSTSLIANRDDLPKQGLVEPDEGYIRLMGLCSHEYFHLWNVKRIKPAVFINPTLAEEVYTPLLWAFEGITSYYDDLALVRCKAISPQDYLDLIAKTVTRVIQGAGRLKQSIAESSFDAWTRFYKQDENAPNAIVSYYAKGMLVAFGLDILLREKNSSLDELMQILWLKHGKTGIGIEDNTIEQIVNKITQQDNTDFFKNYVYGTQELPLKDWFEKIGVEFNLTVKKGADLGAKIIDKAGKTQIIQTFDGGAAQLAGLTAGDEIVALGGIRINAENMNKTLSRYPFQQSIKVIAFRQGELIETDLMVLPAQENTVKLSLNKAYDGHWLG